MAIARMTQETAVFIDKDGTLIQDMPYNVDPANVRLTAGAGKALRHMKNAGYKLIVISNQSGVAKGLFEERELLPVNERIHTLLVP